MGITIGKQITLPVGAYQCKVARYNGRQYMAGATCDHVMRFEAVYDGAQLKGPNLLTIFRDLDINPNGELGNTQDFIKYTGQSEVGVAATSDGTSITYDCGCSPEEKSQNPQCKPNNGG